MAIKTVMVGLATCGISAGGEKVYEAFQKELQDGADFVLRETGCVGMCYREVLVSISNGNQESYLYGEVTPDRVKRIVAEHIQN